jgi:hypothetical protein
VPLIKSETTRSHAWVQVWYGIVRRASNGRLIQYYSLFVSHAIGLSPQCVSMTSFVVTVGATSRVTMSEVYNKLPVECSRCTCNCLSGRLVCLVTVEKDDEVGAVAAGLVDDIGRTSGYIGTAA